MNQSTTPAPAERPAAILLVDDDATNLDVLRQTLAGPSYRLFVARTGEDALKVARRAQTADRSCSMSSCRASTATRRAAASRTTRRPATPP